ncbi:uncharacterized protein [Temnothorax longispinosus]|uniref:uncharacterized protein n=1 Tax=Temnothorax longispinosus TaxID=300112 RepID=UPI003A99710A
MFSHRGLFLAVTIISLASTALADVLVQPYEHQYYSNPRYLQHQSTVSQHSIRSPEQYRTEQLPNQESTRYLSGVQTPVYPYQWNQADARSHVLSYPHRPPYHHYLPRPHHMRFARIGGHGYVRPSVYVGHPQSLTVHNRRKRSRRSDPTSTESSKSEVVAHDNDVAAKSPLTDAKDPTTVDSLLPEHEPTDTTDKRVENRQIKNDYITNPRLFGFYTEDTHPKHADDIPNTWQSMINQYDTNRHTQSPNVAQGETCSDDSRIIYNRPLMRFAQSSSSQKSNDNDYGSKYRDNGSDSASDTVKETAKWFGALYTSLLNKSQYITSVRPEHVYSVPQRKTRYYMEEACGRAAHHEPEKISLQEITNMNMINTAEPSQDKILQIPIYSEVTPKASQYADTAATPTSVQFQPPFVTYVQNPYRSNEESSATNEIVGAPYDTNYNFNYLYNYPRYWKKDWVKGEGILYPTFVEDFFGLKKINDTTSTDASKHTPDRNPFYPTFGRTLE